MKIFAKHKFASIFLILLLFFFGCHKDNTTKPSDNISQNDSTALLEIFRDISKDNNTILDIPSMPVPGEFLNSDDDCVKQGVELIHMFNDLIINPQNVDSLHNKSANSVNYTKNCETYGAYTECTFKEDHGEYQIAVSQIIGPGGTSIDVYYSGIYTGIDYGEMYEIQSHVFSPDNKSFEWLVYRPPVPPESAGELSFYFLMQELDDLTIYTPWGEEHQRKLMYTNFIYGWDNVKMENHIYLGSQDFGDGNNLSMHIIYWSVAKEDIYIGWIGTWDLKKHEGEWCSYDDDENIKDYGPL